MATEHTKENRPKIRRQDFMDNANAFARHDWNAPTKAELRALTDAMVAASRVHVQILPPGKALGRHAGKDVGLVGKNGRERNMNTYGNGNRTPVPSKAALEWAASKEPTEWGEDRW